MFLFFLVDDFPVYLFLTFSPIYSYTEINITFIYIHLQYLTWALNQIKSEKSDINPEWRPAGEHTITTEKVFLLSNCGGQEWGLQVY